VVYFRRETLVNWPPFASPLAGVRRSVAIECVRLLGVAGGNRRAARPSTGGRSPPAEKPWSRASAEPVIGVD